MFNGVDIMVSNIKSAIKAISGAIVVFSSIAIAYGSTIDFEAGLAGSPIGGFYSGLGATFANASFQYNFGLAGSSGSQGLGDITDPVAPPYNPSPSSPIVITFSMPISFFSIVAMDVGADGARIDAYDSAIGGLLVDYDQLIGTGGGTDNFTTLGVSAPGIFRIEIYQPLNVLGIDDGMLFDQVTFAPVPEPAALALFSLGVAAFGIRRHCKLKSH